MVDTPNKVTLPPLPEFDDYDELLSTDLANFAQMFYVQDPGSGITIPKVGYELYDHDRVKALGDLNRFGRIRVVPTFSNWQSFLGNEDILYNKKVEYWQEFKKITAEGRDGYGIGDFKDGTGSTGVTPDDIEFEITQKGDTQVVKWALAGSVGEKETLAAGHVGENIYAELVKILKSAPNNRFKTYYDGVLGSPVAEADVGYFGQRRAIEAQADGGAIILDLSKCVEGIGGGTLTDILVAVAFFGFIREAAAIQANGILTFETKAAAKKALDRILAVGRSGYYDASSRSLAWFMAGGKTTPQSNPQSWYKDDAYVNPVWLWGAIGTISGHAGDMEDYSKIQGFGKINPDHADFTLYFPIVKEAQHPFRVRPLTDQKEYYTNPHAEFVPPPGYTWPTAEDLQGLVGLINGQVLRTPAKLGAFTNDEIHIVADENMLILNDKGQPLLAAASFYQPITREQYLDYHGIDTFLTGDIWLSYEQAACLAEITNVASQEYGIEMSMRRVAESGFRYEVPGDEPDFVGGSKNAGGKVKVAEYAWSVPEGKEEVFAEAKKRVDASILNAKDGIVTLPCGMEMPVAQAKELSVALENAWQGWPEGIYKWCAEYYNELLGMGFGGVIQTVVFVLGMTVGVAILYRIPIIRRTYDYLLKGQGKAHAAGIEGQLEDKEEKMRKVEDNAPDLLKTRKNPEHEIIGRTREIRQILHYYHDLQQGGDKEQIKIFHAPGRSGKGDIIDKGLPDTLRLGYYPDGSPVEPHIREAFSEVRKMNFKKLTAGKVYSNQAEGYLQAVIEYHKEHPTCLLIIDEARDLATKGATDKDPEPYFKAFKEHEYRPTMLVLASEDLYGTPERPGFFDALSMGGDTQQWEGRLTPIFGTLDDEGMKEIDLEYRVLILEKSIRGKMDFYAQRNFVDLKPLLAGDFLKQVIIMANRRVAYPDPKRSLDLLGDFLRHLGDLGRVHHAGGHDGLFVPSPDDFPSFLSARPVDEARVAALGRPKIALDDFDDNLIARYRRELGNRQTSGSGAPPTGGAAAPPAPTAPPPPPTSPPPPPPPVSPAPARGSTPETPMALRLTLEELRLIFPQLGENFANPQLASQAIFRSLQTDAERTLWLRICPQGQRVPVSSFEIAARLANVIGHERAETLFVRALVYCESSQISPESLGVALVRSASGRPPNPAELRETEIMVQAYERLLVDKRQKRAEVTERERERVEAWRAELERQRRLRREVMPPLPL